MRIRMLGNQLESKILICENQRDQRENKKWFPQITQIDADFFKTIYFFIKEFNVKRLEFKPF